jgi:hypothetical protein
MNRIDDLIQQAEGNGTICNINMEDRMMVSKEYKRIFNININIWCNSCIFKSIIEIGNEYKKNKENGERSRKNIQVDTKRVQQKRNKK